MSDSTNAAPPPYPPAPPVADSNAPSGTRTGTVWIWLVVLLPLLSIASIFALDIEGYVRNVLADPNSVGNQLSLYTSPGFLLVVLGGWLITALVIVFSVLDWRTLKARGVPRPFHWGFAFLALAGLGIVYPIGRSIVVKQRTGGGLAPLWATIAVFVISVVVSIVWSVAITQSVMNLVPGYLTT